MRLADFLESPAAEGAGLGPGSPGSVLRALVDIEAEEENHMEPVSVDMG